MKESNLFDLIQNDAVGAIAMHSFVLGFNKIAKTKSKELKFPRIEYMFYVLPIVYNSNSLESFKSSSELYSALQKDNTVVLGLQEIACKTSNQTFDGLNLAFAKKILYYNKEKNLIELMPKFKTKKLPLPIVMMDKENSVKKIQDCAYKLGHIFAKRSESNIQIELNIRF